MQTCRPQIARAWQVRQDLLAHTNQLLGRTHFIMASIFEGAGQYKAALAYSSAALEIVKANYPLGSLIIANEEVKHASLLAFLN